MNKLDTSNKSIADVYALLNADYNTRFAQPEAAKDDEAAKAQALALKTDAVNFKIILKEGIKFANRPLLSRVTVETIARLDLPLANEAVKLQQAAANHFNSLVDMYDAVDKLSPEAKGWFSSGVQKKAVPNADAVVAESATDVYEKAINNSLAKRASMIGAIEQMAKVRVVDKAQLMIFQDADAQPIISAEVDLAIKEEAPNRPKFKEAQKMTAELFEQLNQAFAYTERPPIDAQDLETLKRLKPECIETLEKAQQVCREQNSRLKRHRVFPKNFATLMEELMDKLTVEESRLISVKLKGAPLSSMGSAINYLWPHDVDKVLSQTTAETISPVPGTLLADSAPATL